MIDVADNRGAEPDVTFQDRSNGIVVVGPLEPLLRAAFLRAAREHFSVVEVAAPMRSLRCLGANEDVIAIVLQRIDAAEGEPAEAQRPWIGVSSVGRDVLVVDNVGVTHLDNPTAEELCAYIGANYR